MHIENPISKDYERFGNSKVTIDFGNMKVGFILPNIMILARKVDWEIAKIHYLLAGKKWSTVPEAPFIYLCAKKNALFILHFAR